MQCIKSKIDCNSVQYQENLENMSALLDVQQQLLKKTLQGGGPKYIERHTKAGKLLPRDRVDLLLDRDSWFLELMPLAGCEVSTNSAGAGLIGGIGLLSGVECLIMANESTLKGGAISGIGVKKGLRLAEIAAENHLPTIYLNESAGGDLAAQSEVFVSGGQIFRDITRRSKQKLPTICVVFGNSTAGGAYIPGMSDYVIMVKDRAKVFLAGPPLVKMATGEVCDDESLGGATMHAKISGVADYLAQSEEDAIRQAREIVAHLNLKKAYNNDNENILEPKYDPGELLGIASSDVSQPFDQREVIARVVDGSEFAEFKPLYGGTLICGWTHINGVLVGILANNGVLFSESSNKGAQFIQLCNQQGTPIVFLQNITGFMVGQKYEQEGIIKNGAKLINAVSNSEVPLFTIMTGASYGAGNYGMCGRSYGPRFIFSWPNHKIAIMGATQLTGVMEIIKSESAAKRGIKVDEEQLSKMKELVRLQIESESCALFATARLWDDGIINPRDTRKVLSIALSAALNKKINKTTSFGVFRH